MRLLPNTARLLIWVSLLAGAAGAQEVLDSKVLPEAIRILDSAQSKPLLPCSIQFSGDPRLDLTFRYRAEFSIDCLLRENLQPGARLAAFIRVTPELGKPTILFEYFDIPEVLQQGKASLYAPLSKLEASMSGGFAMGSGKYSVEVVLTDRQGHTCRLLRRLNASEHSGAGKMPFALQRGAVGPLVDARWNGSLAANGPRLTVLLNVHSRIGNAHLHAGDRATLLQSLVTLLNQLPCKSVKLVAFDLDSQQEVFNQEKFDADGFIKLEKALERMEFATIPYRALRKGSWTGFLVDLAQRESTLKESPDDIVFFGVWGSHAGEKVPQEMARTIEISHTHFVYFELFPWVEGGPDGVEQLTRDLHGSVFAIRSPESLEQAITGTLALTAPPLHR